MESKAGVDGSMKPIKQFRMPTREEAEERRRQLEADKPALHFKPKGIALGHTQSFGSATNINPDHTRISTPNGTDPARLAAVEPTSGSAAATPLIVSSRQHYLDQQQQEQARQQKQQQSSVLSDEDFGFEDDLTDVVLDDSLFDIDDVSSKLKATTASQPTSASTKAGASTQALVATATTSASGASLDNTTAQTAPPLYIPKSKATIVVKPSQRGNPLLQFIRNVPYEYGEIVPDYAVGLTSCVLFLSIRYHRLHPEYVFNRIAALGKTFVLRVLLVLVDVDTHQQAIRELTRVAMLNDLTLICAWSNEEAARYIETYKAYENKAPDAIKERVDNDYLSKLTDCLTQIQSVNKTDVVTLSSTFGSLKNIMNASVDELGVLPGFGERKVKRLLEAFDQPFAIDPKKRRQRRR